MAGLVLAQTASVMPGFGGGGGGLAGDSNEIPGLGSGGIGPDVGARVGAGLWLMPDAVRMAHRCPQWWWQMAQSTWGSKLTFGLAGRVAEVLAMAVTDTTGVGVARDGISQGLLSLSHPSTDPFLSFLGSDPVRVLASTTVVCR